MTKRVSIVTNEEVKNNIISAYQQFERENKGEYIVFFAKRPDLVVTVYSSNKSDEFKVLFVGDNALEEAQKFDPNAVEKEPRKKERNARWLCLENQVGSDEVGTGDFFGPICVCAAYVSESKIDYLIKLGVKDSKKLDDDKIREIGKKLIRNIPYSQVSLDNETYNKLVDEKMNMNEMKAKMHNRVLLNLAFKFPRCDHYFVDEFTPEDNYFDYLNGAGDVLKNVTFKTKGESYYPSVAVGSIIARYSFLQKMDKMSRKYGMDFPHGSSSKVDKFAQEFIKKFGVAELRKVAKTNFINYQKIIEDLQ